jgi:hypothetical protein
MTKKTIVTFLLDETGSMQKIKDDTIGGFNAYLASLKELDSEVAFTLICFDSNRTRKVHVGTPIADVIELTADTYTPGAFTPLYDAAVKTIRATAEVAAASPDALVIVVIQTDGDENASREFTRADLADLVKEKTAAGWQFVFLGTGIDAYKTGAGMGFSAGNTMSYAGDKSAQTFAAAGNATRRYVASGGDEQAMRFTSAEKTAAGDRTAAAGPKPMPMPTPHPTPSPKPVPPKPRSLVEDLDLKI